jgi:hypothetical protein
MRGTGPVRSRVQLRGHMCLLVSTIPLRAPPTLGPIPHERLATSARARGRARASTCACACASMRARAHGCSHACVRAYRLRIRARVLVRAFVCAFVRESCVRHVLAHRLFLCSLVRARLFLCLSAPTHACVRAGKLAWGVKGSNACPAGSYIITDATQCRAAAATAGKPWANVGSWYDNPRGCFWYTVNNDVNLNTHSTGRADPNRQPLCAVPATGAHRARTRAHPPTLMHTLADTRAR